MMTQPMKTYTNSSTFIVHDTTSQELTYIFFTATEVLVDNQAGRSILKNEELLSDVCATKPYYIGGINGASRELLL